MTDSLMLEGPVDVGLPYVVSVVDTCGYSCSCPELAGSAVWCGRSIEDSSVDCMFVTAGPECASCVVTEVYWVSCEFWLGYFPSGVTLGLDRYTNARVMCREC